MVAILDDAASWLRSRGIDQWQPGTFETEVYEAVSAGEMYVAESEGSILGCFRLGRADADAIAAWSRVGMHEDSGGTLYLSRMAVGDERHGTNNGSQLIGLAMEMAKNLGVGHVRLDCWAGNGTLRAFYTAEGFTRVSDVESPTKDRAGEVIRVSLFERLVEQP